MFMGINVLGVKLGFIVDLDCLEVVWALAGWWGLFVLCLCWHLRESCPVSSLWFRSFSEKCMQYITFFCIVYYFNDMTKEGNSRSMLLHIKSILYDWPFFKCRICKVPSFSSTSPLIAVLSAVVTSVRWFSGTEVQFQKSIWKIVQRVFPFTCLECWAKLSVLLRFYSKTFL